MDKYCCFLHPKEDYSEKNITDLCPDCNLPYNFPIINYPDRIRDYEIIKPLNGRGFYSTAYLCKRGSLDKQYVLKVSSKQIYDYTPFKKDFSIECQTHAAIAVDTEHIVGIYDYFQETLMFDKTKIDCNISVIDFVDGPTLEEKINDTNITIKTISQIAIDLFCIWQAFSNKHKNHNDLHPNNIIIKELKENALRPEAIDRTIRAVAISNRISVEELDALDLNKNKIDVVILGLKQLGT